MNQGEDQMYSSKKKDTTKNNVVKVNDLSRPRARRAYSLYVSSLEQEMHTRIVYQV